MAQEQNSLYSLEIRAPGQSARKCPVGARLTVGNSQEADLRLDGIGIAPLHCSFKTQNDMLSVHHLASGYAMALDKQELGAGKMYVLDRGDKIMIGDHELVVRKDEVLVLHKKGAASAPAPAPAPRDLGPEEVGQKTSVSTLLKSSKGEATGVRLPVAAKPGLFARLFKKDKTKLKIKKKMGVKRFTVPPGPLSRVWSLALDACLVYSGVHFAIPFLGLETERDQAVIIVAPELQMGARSLAQELPLLAAEYQLPIPADLWTEVPHVADFMTRPEILLPLMLFCLVQLASNLLLGTSLGLYLMGVKSDNSFLRKRLKALLRAGLGLFTLPFLIFDAPLVFGKRSLKEFVTLSELEFGSKLRKILGAVLAIPILMLACFLAPAFFALDYLDGLPIERAQLPPGKIPSDPKAVLFVGDLAPAKARMNAVLPADSVAWFEVDLDKKRATLALMLHDTDKKGRLKISWPRLPDIRQALAWAQVGDPLFPYLHTPMDAYLDSGATSPNPQAVQDIVEVVRSSMALGTPNILEHLLAHGPFINGYVHLRAEVFKLLGTSEAPELEIVRIAGQEYLGVVQPQRRLLLNIGLQSSPPLHWEFAFAPKDATWARGLSQKLLRGASELDPTVALEGAESALLKSARLLLALAQGQAIEAQDESWLLQDTLGTGRQALAVEAALGDLEGKLGREERLFTKLKETANTDQLGRMATEWAKMRQALLARDGAFFGAAPALVAPAEAPVPASAPPSIPAKSP